MGDVVFHCADTRMMQFHARSCDAVITDPPYSEHVQGAGKLLSGTSTRAISEVDAGFTPIGDRSFTIPDVVRFADVAKRWALFNCDLESLGAYREANTPRWVRSGIYIKARAMPQLSGDRPGNRCEGIAIFHNEGRKRWNGKGTSAFWFVNPENRKATKHPTGKPLILALRLVDLFTDPGELVFDPFCGSGAYGIACALLGRRYVGIDINSEHVQTACARLHKYSTDEKARSGILDKYEEWKTTKGLQSSGEEEIADEPLQAAAQ